MLFCGSCCSINFNSPSFFLSVLVLSMTYHLPFHSLVPHEQQCTRCLNFTNLLTARFGKCIVQILHLLPSVKCVSWSQTWGFVKNTLLDHDMSSGKHGTSISIIYLFLPKSVNSLRYLHCPLLIGNVCNEGSVLRDQCVVVRFVQQWVLFFGITQYYLYPTAICVCTFLT